MRPPQGKASEVELLAAGLPMGLSMRAVCPACQGGSDRERSLSITRTSDGLKWHCFRSSCPEQGVTTGGAYARTEAPTAKKPHEPYLGAWYTLEEPDRDYFLDRFDLSYTDEIGWNDDGQYVLRILDRYGQRRGFNVRRGGWTGQPKEPRENAAKGTRPKTRTFLDRETDPNLSIHRPARKSPVLVLVEDQISAMKVAQSGRIGAALLGDGLNFAKIRELQQIKGVEQTIFAMDADATGRAFDMAQKWGLALPRARVMILTQDLKDLPRREVSSLLEFFDE